MSRAPVVGVDLLWPTNRVADAAAHDVVRALASRGTAAVVLTHLTRLGPLPHVTLSVEATALSGADLIELLGTVFPGAVLSDSGSDTAAHAGAVAHTARGGGRAVHYRGVKQLTGRLPVAEVLARTSIDAVQLLGGAGPADPATTLVTRDHVRPTYQAGRLVLAVEWAAGRTLVPFETPNPTPCCADHA